MTDCWLWVTTIINKKVERRGLENEDETRDSKGIVRKGKVLDSLVVTLNNNAVNLIFHYYKWLY